MKQFVVRRGRDAYVIEEAVVSAETATNAEKLVKWREIASNLQWKSTGEVRVFDDTTVMESEAREFDPARPEEEVINYSLTVAECNIIIAALRLWQRTESIPTEITDIADDHGSAGCFLSDHEIDRLIEGKLNA